MYPEFGARERKGDAIQFCDTSFKAALSLSATSSHGMVKINFDKSLSFPASAVWNAAITDGSCIAQYSNSGYGVLTLISLSFLVRPKPGGVGVESRLNGF